MPALTKVTAWVKAEPVTSSAILQAFMAIGLAFGWWHWSVEQTGAVVGMVAVVLSLLVRANVIPLVALEAPPFAPRTPK